MAYRSLADFFGVEFIDFKLVDPAHLTKTTAFMAIDVQRAYADPTYTDPTYKVVRGTPETDQISADISAMAAGFRKLGVSVVWAYKYFKGKANDPTLARGGWHKVQPEPNDIIIGKTENTVFAYTDAARILRDAGIENLLVCGFNTNACVAASVEHALDKHFNVCVLGDLTANGCFFKQSAEDGLALMCEGGVHISKSQDALSFLRSQQYGA